MLKNMRNGVASGSFSIEILKILEIRELGTF
jgi:hypothetical protein